MKTKIFLTSLIIGISIFLIGIILSLTYESEDGSIIVFHNTLMYAGLVIVSGCLLYQIQKLPRSAVFSKTIDWQGKFLACLVSPAIASVVLVLLISSSIELIAPNDYETAYSNMADVITGMWTASMLWICMVLMYLLEIFFLIWKKPAKNEL